MRLRYAVGLLVCTMLIGAGLVPPSIRAQQGGGAQSGLTPAQRLEIMRSRLETMRRTLNSGLAGINAKDSGAKDASADDPRSRLRGLEKEVSSLLSEVSDTRGKQERAEKYDVTLLDKLEESVKDIGVRVETTMRETSGARQSVAGSAGAVTDTPEKRKKRRGILSRLMGRGGDEKYEELVGTVAAGRDRVLFEEATKEARKSNFETSRDLFQVIITTYPDSPFLQLSKLAFADTFYLEGTTSALILSAQAYQDWLAFFPTHPLADDVMLKLAEVEMRQMGLPDRQTASAKKAEQRIKVMIQQFPNTSLRPEAEIKLREIQENLAMHDFLVGKQYLYRYFQQKAVNPKGAQSRFLEITRKYPHFSYTDEVLYDLGVTFVEEEEPDEAAKHFGRILREYPNSKLAEKAREHLQAMGLEIPHADPTRMNVLPPERPGMIKSLFIELRGAAPTTINKKGILISGDDKAEDLIQEAIENNGQLKHSVPTAPVTRRDPARPVDVPLQPVRPKTGAENPPGVSQPKTAPTVTSPATPATTPPAEAKPKP